MSTSTNEPKLKRGDTVKIPIDVEAYVDPQDPSSRVMRSLGVQGVKTVIQSVWDQQRKATIVEGGHAVAVHLDKLTKA